MPGRNSNVIYSFAIDPDTGALTTANAPMAAGGSPTAVAPVDPSNRFLYAVHIGANNISAYSIEPTSGALTALPGHAANHAVDSKLGYHQSERKVYLCDQRFSGARGVQHQCLDGSADIHTGLSGPRQPRGLHFHHVTGAVIDSRIRRVDFGSKAYSRHDGAWPTSARGASRQGRKMSLRTDPIDHGPSIVMATGYAIYCCTRRRESRSILQWRPFLADSCRAQAWKTKP